MNWLQYLLEANLYLCLFYAGYYLFLSKETYYNLNRGYLLLTCGAAFIIPFLQLGFLNPVTETTVIASYTVGSAATGGNTSAETSMLTWQSALLYFYITGAVAAFALFGIKLYKLFSLIKNHAVVKHTGYSVIYIDEANTAFSFFNYLFIGKNTSGADTITSHELVHIRQKHSYDIIFTELVKILNWFNPFVYMLQNSVKRVHEYIADEQTAGLAEDKLAYSTFLLNNAYGLQGLSFSNSFFNYNLLKNRITMLNQQRSGKLAGLKYLLAVPLCGAMLCASTLSFSKNYGFVDLLPLKSLVKKAKPLKLPASAEINIDSPKMYKAILLGSDTVQMVKGWIVGDKDTIKMIQGKVINPKGSNDTPAIVNGHVFKLKLDTPVSAKTQQKKPIQVMDMPINTPFEGLLTHVTNNIKYPQQARNNKTVGAVVVKFSVGDDLVINKTDLLMGIGNGCDQEVANAVSSYTKKMLNKPGAYILTVNFSLRTSDDKSITSKSTPQVENFKKSFAAAHPSAGELNIVGYIK